MPRKATGNPRGRPKGTGHLAAPKRLTLWLDGALYARLEDYAERRRYSRGTPELAGCVRALLDHALPLPDNRQTGNVPRSVEEINKQTRNSYANGELNNEQIENIPEGKGVIIEQTENPLVPVAEALPPAVEPSAPAPTSVGPPFDPQKYRLGSQCHKYQHASHGPAGNLRTIMQGDCVMCKDAKKAEKDAAKAR